jgi:hypothetical protein
VPAFQATAVHRAEHLHVTNRIEAEATRNAVANDFNDLAGGVIGIGGFDEEEIRAFIRGSTKLRRLARSSPSSDDLRV